jgi:hypothetical protein
MADASLSYCTLSSLINQSVVIPANGKPYIDTQKFAELLKSAPSLSDDIKKQADALAAKLDKMDGDETKDKVYLAKNQTITDLAKAFYKNNFNSSFDLSMNIDCSAGFGLIGSLFSKRYSYSNYNYDPYPYRSYEPGRERQLPPDGHIITGKSYTSAPSASDIESEIHRCVKNVDETISREQALQYANLKYNKGYRLENHKKVMDAYDELAKKGIVNLKSFAEKIAHIEAAYKYTV